MHVYTNAELTAQVADLKQQLAEALNWRPAQPTTADNVQRIYKAYPRKVGTAAAKKAIAKALTKIGPRELEMIVTKYANAIAWQQNRSLIPNPATWFNQERWLDDPKEWENPEKAKPQADQFSL